MEGSLFGHGHWIDQPFPILFIRISTDRVGEWGGGSVIDDVADDVAMIKKRSLTGSQPEFVVECYGFRCLKFRNRTMAAAVPTPLPTPPPTCSAFDPNQMNEAYNRHQEMTTQLDNPTTAAPHHERYVAPPFMFASADMNRKQLLARRPPGKFFP